MPLGLFRDSIAFFRIDQKPYSKEPLAHVYQDFMYSFDVIEMILQFIYTD